MSKSVNWKSQARLIWKERKSFLSQFALMPIVQKNFLFTLRGTKSYVPILIYAARLPIVRDWLRLHVRHGQWQLADEQSAKATEAKKTMRSLKAESAWTSGGGGQRMTLNQHWLDADSMLTQCWCGGMRYAGMKTGDADEYTGENDTLDAAESPIGFRSIASGHAEVARSRSRMWNCACSMIALQIRI